MPLKRPIKGSILVILLIISSSAICHTRSKIIEYNTTIRLTKEGLLEKTFTYKIEIDSKDADWLADIHIPYDEHDKPVITEAAVYSIDGTLVKKLNNKDIITKSDISDDSFYEDSYIKEFTLRGNEYPFIIKYSYKITCSNFVNLCVWRPGIFSDIDVAEANLTIDIPSGYKIKIHTSGIKNFDVDSVEGRKILHWQVINYSPPENESFMPGYEGPSIMAIPLNFHYGISGSSENWESFGGWVDSLNRGLSKLPLSEEQLIRSLGIENFDKKQVIRALYHYMQDHTRYINVTLDIGGMKSYPASYVSTNKYGDCKALCTYMKALLENFNIKSYYSLIYAGKNPEPIISDFPGQQFNHVILCVPLEKDTIWLENTSRYSPFNYLGTSTQDRSCLVINSKSRLVKTPALKNSELLQSSRYIYDLHEDGSGSVLMEKVLRGDLFTKYLYLSKELNQKELEEFVRTNFLPKNAELKNWNFISDDRDSSYIRLKLELTLRDQFRKIGNVMVLNPLNTINLGLEDPGLRRMPLKFNYPIILQDSIEYNLKFSEFPQVDLPENIIINNNCGSYSALFSLRDNKITVLRKFVINKNYYNLDDYPKLYNFIDTVSKSIKRSGIIINN